MLDRIVPVEDAEVSAFLDKQLRSRAEDPDTSAGVESLKSDAKGVAATIKTKDGKSAEHRFSPRHRRRRDRSGTPRISGSKRSA